MKASDYCEAADRLRNGEFATCEVRDNGMKPFLKQGQDSIVFAPVKIMPDKLSREQLALIEKHNKVSSRKWKNISASDGRITIHRRDIVLVCRHDNTAPKLMRVIHVWGTLLLLRQDSSYGPYEPATISDIIGVAVEGTYMGGSHFNATSRKWRYMSKAWTASYRVRLWAGRKQHSALLTAAVCASAVLTLFSCRHTDNIVTVENGQFIRNGEPYYFIGTNFWYGSILGSEGTGGNRERLCMELDSLKALGIENLRVLVGSDGDHGVYTKVEPTLQYAPGKYNDTLLKGLDYFLVELGKRDMEAVLYLTNSWEWSGGYSQYLKWAGYGDIPLPRVAGYNAYVDYVSNFIKSDSAKGMYRRFVMDIVSRTNTVTGKPYRDDPAIFSWQLCNEPRPFGEGNKEAFRDWLLNTAELIKSIDPNHLISVGSEGKYGCEWDIDLWAEIGKSPYIDYLNIHIWPSNWGWTSRDDMSTGNIAKGLENSHKYLNEHLAVARAVGKPLVVEEFGLPRDGFQFTKTSTVSLRDTYYESLLSLLPSEAAEGGILAGFNFWGWGGFAEPSSEHLMWMPGDDYTGDPAQEEQGLFSVFASDRTTIEIIKDNIIKTAKSIHKNE